MASIALREVVERSAAPAAVNLALERLAEAHHGTLERLQGDDGLSEAVVAVMGASRSLTRLLVTDPASLDVLAALDQRPDEDFEDQLGLARWKRNLQKSQRH